MQAELSELGYRLLAIAPDRPAKVAETQRKLKLDFPIYSDASAGAIEQFGLGYVQNDPRYQKLLEESSGFDHHILPVPATILVAKDKSIQLMHADPRYPLRLPSDVLVSAARSYGEKE